MIEKINKYLEEAKEFVASSVDEIEAFRIKFMGKKGLVNDLFSEFKKIPFCKNLTKKKYRKR